MKYEHVQRYFGCDSKIPWLADIQTIKLCDEDGQGSQRPNEELWRARGEGADTCLRKVSRRQGCPHLLEHTTGDVHSGPLHTLTEHHGIHPIPLIIAWRSLSLGAPARTIRQCTNEGIAIHMKVWVI